jgi:CheY-like chemotaxis protein
MGPTFTSRTTQLVADARRTGEVPVLTPADRQAVRTDVAGWHGEAIVMRAEAGNAAVWETDTIAVGLRHEAMAVDVAYDGGQALEKASFNRYNAAVLDRDMPGGTGDVPSGKDLFPMAGSGTVTVAQRADGWTPNLGDRRFVGYVVELTGVQQQPSA